jgi:DNA adenine methylase
VNEELLGVSDALDPAMGLRPFLRWAGGKQQMVGRLLRLVPPETAYTAYREPFLGAGALYFALRPKAAHLSDSNDHLVRCYAHVRDHSARVAKLLRQHKRSSSAEHYYRVREQYNATRTDSAAQAARFIYLNRTCFNGIFRVNMQGDFNVPYGRKDPPVVPTEEELREIGLALTPACIFASDFRVALEGAESGDFVYLDPPYPPLNGTAYFTHYTADRFRREDQIELAEIAHDLHARGCLVMMTNADVEIVRTLYRRFTFTELEVTRYVTCKKQRHRVSEVVITNYEVP